MKYIKVTRSDTPGSYIQPLADLAAVIDGEFDGIDWMDAGTTICLEVVVMTEEEYEALPEFDGW